MKRMKRSQYVLFSAIILIGILLDQLTKLIAVRMLKPIDTFPIIKNVLHLTYVDNRGAAFGMLADQRWIFIIVSTVTLVCMCLYLYSGKAEGRLMTVSLSMIISGGIGNMIDRIALGYVVDFIDFRLINFAVFNGADSFVCVGAGMLVLALLIDIVNEAKKNKKDSEK